MGQGAGGKGISCRFAFLIQILKMSNTLVGVVIPLYMKADQVLRSVRSVQAQTFTNWEMVVVDDGSSDDGAERVRAVGDSRIRVHTQINQGVSAARNWGIQLSTSDLIAFLDADDEWHPEFLETVVAMARSYPQAAWYATGYQIRHPREGVFDSRLRGVKSNFIRGLLPNYFLVAMQSDPPVWSSAVALRRAAIESIGGFPLGVDSGEDLLTWARLAVRYPLAYDVRPLAIFHVSGYDRHADPKHLVSAALTELVSAYPNTVGLRNYLGLWYRIQSVMAMRYDEAGLAQLCARRAVWYGPRQWRNGYTLLLAWLPSTWRRCLDGALRRAAEIVKIN